VSATCGSERNCVGTISVMAVHVVIPYLAKDTKFYSDHGRVFEANLYAGMLRLWNMKAMMTRILEHKRVRLSESLTDDGMNL